MAELDYTNLPAMHALAVERSGTEPSDLDNWLELTAASTSAGPMYRPHFVIAMMIERRMNTERLVEADGVKFAPLSQQVRAERELQAARDAALKASDASYRVPEAFKASGNSGVRVVF